MHYSLMGEMRLPYIDSDCYIDVSSIDGGCYIDCPLLTVIVI